MASDVSIFGKFEYSHQVFYRMWVDHLAGRVSMDSFMTYGRRFVISRILKKKYHRTVHIDVLEELVQDTLLAMWRMAEKKSIPSRAWPVFIGYLNTLANRQFYKVFHRMYDQLPEVVEDLHIHAARYLRRIPTSHDVEDEVYVYELPMVIRKEVLGGLRFYGTNVHGAVKYILDRVFNDEPVVETWLKIHYGIDNPVFLEEHVRVRIKMALYDLRNDVDYPTLEGQRETIRDAISQCIPT